MGKEDKQKKSVLGAVGDAITKAGELGVKAGGAIKDFSDSDTKEKMTEGVKKGAKAAADGVVKGARFAADGLTSGAQKAAESVKASAEESAKKRAEKKELRKEIKEEIKAEKEKRKTDKADESNHLIIEFKKPGIRILIPDGYEKNESGKNRGSTN